MPALDALRDRLAELADLSLLGHLAAWDQRTMMPPGGSPARAHQLATLERLAHERATADEVGEWLEELEREGAAGDLGELDRDLVRLARRDWDRSRRVPTDLAAELAQAGAEGQDVWQAARADDDFAAFAPALRRNIELARSYAACFEGFARPYDALLADYDFGLTAARIQEVFGRLAEALPPLVAQAAQRPAPRPLDVPVAAQRAAVTSTLARLGVKDDSWRVDVSAHPFSTNVGRRDSRITTRYEDGQLESVLAAMHEFGHSLYERQIAPELARTNLGHGTSMSIHESQSKLWENHVGRNPAFGAVIAGELTAGGFPIDPDTLLAAFGQVRPSLIRVSADELTYPLHIVLRFELELALIEGRLDVADLPAAWNDGMRRLLGVEVPRDADGVLQDVHWAGGAFGYFPSYALGTLIAAQLWDRLEQDAGSQDEALAGGDVTAIRTWLADHVHHVGRRLDTEPLVASVTGHGVEVEPFLAHVGRVAAR
ncbi:MAG TPA: carboxypeptidase M32 [Baekduia sp.]|uniref:carboxypeptidase M32 n=1 Tax=Baekduia sp. TaxID=2600305 RepID=UPI002B83AE56|nr:carboxypeptidase M32 [Baekduia sp.]HMJ32956.1 carboxypeptidase M32 [Baekduia sp.]